MIHKQSRRHGAQSSLNRAFAPMLSFFVMFMDSVSANFDCAVLKHFDRVAGIGSIQEILAQLVDGDDAVIHPDVRHQQAADRQRVDVIGEQHRLGRKPHLGHAHEDKASGR